MTLSIFSNTIDIYVLADMPNKAQKRFHPQTGLHRKRKKRNCTTVYVETKFYEFLARLERGQLILPMK